MSAPHSKIPVPDLRSLASYEFSLPRDFDVFGTLRFGRFGQWDPTQRLSDGHYVKAFRYQEAICVLDARVHDGRLNVEIRGQSAMPSESEVRRFFGLHRPPLAVSGHSTLERWSRQRPGIHLGVTLHLGLDCVKTVFQQLIEWRDAAVIWRKWILRTGEHLTSEDLYCPPTYRGLYQQPLDLLHSCGLSRKRALVVREVARLGPRIDQWAGEPSDTLRRRLMTISGIGAWTTEHCLGFSLNLPDIVVTGDYQLPHTVAWSLAGEERGTDRRMFELLEPWRGQRWSVLRMIFASDVRAPRRGPRLNRGRPSRPH